MKFLNGVIYCLFFTTVLVSFLEKFIVDLRIGSMKEYCILGLVIALLFKYSFKVENRMIKYTAIAVALIAMLISIILFVAL